MLSVKLANVKLSRCQVLCRITLFKNRPSGSLTKLNVNKTVLDEFFRETFHDKFYVSVEELQEGLDQWLHYYNYERPHRGYRNMGRRPIETIEKGKVIKKQLYNEQAA